MTVTIQQSSTAVPKPQRCLSACSISTDRCEWCAGLEPGPPLFCDVERQEFPMPRPMTVEQYLGYLRSWSAYQTWRESRDGSEEDPLMGFAAELSRTLGVKLPTDTLPVMFSIFAIFARKA